MTDALINWIPALSNVPPLIINGSLVMLTTLTIYLLTRWSEYLLATVAAGLYLAPLIRHMM